MCTSLSLQLGGKEDELDISSSPFVAEVEQLLSPEESAIFARNETFQLEKISTVSFKSLKLAKSFYS